MELLKILFVEDISTDVDIAIRELKKGKINFTYEVVDTEIEFRKALSNFLPDLIISDYAMPNFDGMRALKITRNQSIFFPFIILTGSMNEETAVDCMKAGADDYVIKEKIKRLPFAVNEVIARITASKEKERVEQELFESERKFTDIFYKHTAAKLIIDPVTADILELNRAASGFYGWSIDELKSMNFTQINSKTLVETLQDISEIINQGTILFEDKHLMANGKFKNVELFSSVIKIKDKDYLHVIIHDITEKKRAEKKLLLLTRAVEQSSASIMITDANGDIVYVNPGFEKITGYTLNEVKNKNPRFLKSDYHKPDYFEGMWKTISSGNNWDGEMQNIKKNGDRYWLKSTISPILSNERKITHYIAVREDITEKKRMYENLVVAKEKAEESDRLKSAFLANMSHELRTPMNGIMGFTNLLLEPDLESNQKEEYIEIIHKSGARMLNTISDIIEISNIEAGIATVNESEVDFKKTAHEIVQFFQVEASHKGLTINLEQELPHDFPTLKTDKGKLESIITNLLKNAIKFTDNGCISVGFVVCNDHVKFYVNDTGVGIPEDRLEAIFNRFEQADVEDTRVFEGSGLGLTISKSYVEMLGGKIWVESEVNKGSSFCFSLPYTTGDVETIFYEEKCKDNTIKNRAINDKKIKVLIAEDDYISSKFLSTILESINCEVIHCFTGEETVRTVKDHTDINIVLMDLKMPQMNGFEATERIREFNQKIQIIAQTAFSFPSDCEKALRSGCNDYITKPIDKTKLIDIINKIKNSLFN